jgi:hypothetical protein
LTATDAPAGAAWRNVELVDPVILEHEYGENDTVVVGHPDLSLAKDDSFEPRAHLVVGVHRRRDGRNRRRPRAEPQAGKLSGLLGSRSPDLHE